MKKVFFTFGLFVSFLCHSQESCQYLIHFNDGTVKKGIVSEINLNQDIKFQDKDGYAYTRPINEIIKIIKVDSDSSSREPIQEVPFVTLDLPPVFKGCDKNLNKEDLKACTSSKIDDFFKTHFNKDAFGANFGRHRISVTFKIDTSGKVIDITAKASIKEAEKEAIRVAEMMPKFIPGIYKGETVITKYALPILINY